MLSVIPLWALLTCAVVAYKGPDPPEPFYWSTDCWTSDIHWMGEDANGNPEIQHKEGSGFEYDWMLTKTVCEHSYHLTAQYLKGRCVAATYDSPIQLPNFDAECQNFAKGGFYQIASDGLPDFNRKYMGLAQGHGYKYGT
ncbi:hypothetical protein PTMSG1_09069 [Pyrenophora teres f. maculata]|nr:hypothetical protein PTMSG1_09069 [Pyrenophora teres f. maculata]